MAQESTGISEGGSIGPIKIGLVIFFLLIMVMALAGVVLETWQYFLIILGILLFGAVATLLSWKKLTIPGIGIGRGLKLGKITSYIFNFFLLLLILFVIGAGLWYVAGAADHNYTPSELQGMCNGACKIANESGRTYIQLSGGTLTIPASGEIGAFQIVWTTHKAEILAMPYRFEYEEVFSGYTADSQRSPKYLRMPKVYYNGEIQYAEQYGKPVEKIGDYPDNLKINNFFGVGSRPTISLLVNNGNTITLGSGTPPKGAMPMKGNIIISSDSAKIWYVGVYDTGPSRIGTYVGIVYNWLRGLVPM